MSAPREAPLAAWPLLLAAAGIAALAAMDAAIKHLSQTNHVLIVSLGRYVLGAAFAFVIWSHAGRPVITAEMWRAHGLRGLVIACSATSFFWALSLLPLAEAVTLSFVAQLLVPPVAWIMLGERMRLVNLAAIALGFAGVLIAVQGAPSAAEAPERPLGVALILFAAVTYAISIALVRARAQLDGAPIVNLLASLIPALFVAAPALVFGTPPRLSDAPIFLLMGLLAACGWYLLARAYAKIEAQRVAPLQFTELIWAALLGFVFFRELPRPEVVAGAAVIVSACALVFWDERRRAPA